MATHEQLIGAVQVVANLARCIALKRALAAADPDPALNFWRVLHGNLLDMAVIEWCKLFGSDDQDHQLVHWKNVFTDEAVFRADLLTHLRTDLPTWTTYWHQLKAYRDQHVAHLDFSKRDVTHYPDLDAALASAAYYYGRLIADLRAQGEVRFPDELGTYYEQFLAQAREIAHAATASTRGFSERVG